jgi:branched-chain amino acid transport system ATP-binding protein
VVEPLLEIQGLDVSYGQSKALFDVSVQVPEGSVLAVLGANGAGKSTLARAVSGLVPPASGRIMFDGQDITRNQPHQTRKLGLTYVPEGRGIFRSLSVADNLRLAVAQEQRRERQSAIDRVIEMFPLLGSRTGQTAGSLSGGEQQMLALARVLAVPPKLIMADELSLGLAPLVVEAVFQRLEECRGMGITLILSEQFVHRALKLADNCLILTRGRIGWFGPAVEARREILDQYLGDGDAAPDPPGQSSDAGSADASTGPEPSDAPSDPTSNAHT